MECFVHESSQAIGLCKVCARGICHACAVPVTNGLACSPEHVPLADALAQVQIIQAKNKGLYRVQRLVQCLAAGALTVLGLGFAYQYPHSAIGWGFLGLGLVMSAVFVIAVTRKR